MGVLASICLLNIFVHLSFYQCQFISKSKLCSVTIESIHSPPNKQIIKKRAYSSNISFYIIIIIILIIEDDYFNRYEFLTLEAPYKGMYMYCSCQNFKEPALNCFSSIMNQKIP